MPLPATLQKAIAALFSQPGDTELSLRRAVLERTRSGEGQVPEALRDYVNKIADRPWTLSDEDFARLRASGYSDDQIYELTLAASLGAGLQRFDAGLRALDEAG